MHRRITVVVPSYNRSGLLPQTIPSYLQEEVLELILADDCSTDDTPQVVRLLSLKDPRIGYVRSERNLRQMHAKNLGIAAAKGEFVYFGDDDSILLPGSLGRLVATLEERAADIVGAASLYMDTEADEADLSSFLARQPRLSIPLVEKLSLHTHFGVLGEAAVDAPFVHSAFLCRASIARDTLFDEAYTGNCYREETDFLVRAGASGAKIVFEPRAVQINLPRSKASGGAQGQGSFIGRRLRYFSQSAGNNWRFLTKNRKALEAVLGIDVSPIIRQSIFLFGIARGIACYPFKKAFGRG